MYNDYSMSPEYFIEQLCFIKYILYYDIVNNSANTTEKTIYVV
jgi:hypothetical protein